MSNKMFTTTTVVFEHEMDLDQFPQLLTYPEAELKQLLGSAVVSIFKLRETEREANAFGTHSFIRVKEVL